MKTGVLFVNLGGPDSLAAVKPFLFNLFADPDISKYILRFPGSELFQKPLAWLISTIREKKVQTFYDAIGGRSPILPLTQAQANAMQAQLASEGIDVNVYIAMRYWNPFTDDALDQIEADGIEQLIVVPMYPQFSLTSTGSSLNELERCMKRRKMNIPVNIVKQYYDHPDYLAAVADLVAIALVEHTWTCPKEDVTILFSAHSLPQEFVEQSQDVYPGQIDETAELLMKGFFPHNPWKLCYQSKVGRMPWLEPSTEQALEELGKDNVDNVLIIPISFVSDHIETLYEVDLLYLPFAKDQNIRHCNRTQSLNTHPKFITALCSLVKNHIKAPLTV